MPQFKVDIFFYMVKFSNYFYFINKFSNNTHYINDTFKSKVFDELKMQVT